MWLIKSLFIVALGIAAIQISCAGSPPDTANVEQRVNELLARMTLEEKVGQMCQYVGLETLKENAQRKGKTPANNDAVGLYPQLTFEQIEKMVRDEKIGSFLHVVTAEEANRLQALAQESRLKIPLLIGIDAIHGDGLVRGATVYPTPLGMAATFDEALVEKMSRETALEIRANGSQWTFAPNVDVARDARWGRCGETFGEDPYLVGCLGAAMVRGLQGPDATGSNHVLACIKHAIAGSQPINGLNAAPTDISERTLRGVFLPPYLVAIRAGAGSLMTAHNELNGVPCHANRWLVEDVLRGECGFNGFVVSDWMDIERLVDEHHTATNQEQAVYQTVMSGMDMHMHGPGFLEPLVKLVKEGRIPESRVDESVRRILRAKFKLGLFEQAQVSPEQCSQFTYSAEHQATALESARKSIVLLKNEKSLLPIDTQKIKRILVTGPLANTQALLGDWSLPQPDGNVITPLAGLRQAAPSGCEIVHYDCGAAVKATKLEAIREAARQAAEADMTVLVVGENSLRYDEKDRTGGENTDRSDLELPGDQLTLVQAVVGAGKPVVVVLINSRPIGSEWTVAHVPALLEAFEPGCKGGQALGEILFGKVNPSGKLPITIPRNAGQIQVYYNHLPSEYFHKYVIGQTDPLFWFGHGLSYTTFQYENLQLPTKIAPNQPVKVTVDVTNTGSRAGEEVVLAYVHAGLGEVTTPVKELKAFKRILLQPGEKKTVELTIADDQLKYFNTAMKLVAPNDFEVQVGGLQGRCSVF